MDSRHGARRRRRHGATDADRRRPTSSTLDCRRRSSALAGDTRQDDLRDRASPAARSSASPPSPSPTSTTPTTSWPPSTPARRSRTPPISSRPTRSSPKPAESCKGRDGGECIDPSTVNPAVTTALQGHTDRPADRRRSRHVLGGVDAAAVRRTAARVAVADRQRESCRRIELDARRRRRRHLRRPAVRQMGSCHRVGRRIAPSLTRPSTSPSSVSVPADREYVTQQTLDAIARARATASSARLGIRRRRSSATRRRSTTCTKRPTPSPTCTPRSPNDSWRPPTEHGDILYAVPGSPLVLERSVRHLRDDARVECTVLPAMSFLDVAFARLGIDPVEVGGATDRRPRVRDRRGRRPRAAVRRPHPRQLGAQRHQAGSRRRARRRAGRDPATTRAPPTNRSSHTTWAELDRTVEADHLTCIYIPHLGGAGGRVAGAVPSAGAHAARAVPVGQGADPRVA